MTTESAQHSTETVNENSIPAEGDVLAGKFRIDRVLGRGGMGVVVAAHHMALRQKVAIKILLPESAQREDACERFLREARAAVSIQSEHVARVTDVGTLENGLPYMVMELLSGSDLGQVLQQRGPLPIEEAVDYVLQAGEAIAEAHALGLIHRDLKPANLFLTARADGSPLVKVLDFGLSKVTKGDSIDPSLTATNAIMGSPYYMSPEQIRNLKATDWRADIWAMGVILYELLTGARPFEASALGELFIAIAADPTPSLRALRPDVPVELEAAILRCLEKEPAARTQTMAELARALAPFCADISHLSIERIMRVLSDPAMPPRPPMRSFVSIAPGAITAPPPSAAAAAAPEPRRSEPGASSTSMPSMSLSKPRVTELPAAPARNRRATVIAFAAMALMGVIGAGSIVGMRVRKGEAIAAQAAPQITAAAPMPEPSPSPAAPRPSDAPVAPAVTVDAPGAPVSVAAVPARAPRTNTKSGAPASSATAAPTTTIAPTRALVPAPAEAADPGVPAELEPDPPAPPVAAPPPAAPSTTASAGKVVKKAPAPPAASARKHKWWDPLESTCRHASLSIL